MKTAKIFDFLLVVMCLILTTTLFTACSSDDEGDDNMSFPSEGDDNENAGSGNSTYELLLRNISTSVYYGDYSWNISIKSNLSKTFPGINIVYGVESGYGRFRYYEHFKFDREYIQKNDGTGNIEVSYPVFVGDEYGSENLYWYSYKYLKDKKAHGGTLEGDEKDLWNEIIACMNKSEYNAKSTFCGRLYAQFDNTRYVFYNFGQKPSSDSGGNNSNGDSGNANGNGSTSYEKPEIELVDYTCYTTSIIAKYRIYNQDKAKVTSAKGYYGTSSASRSVAATIAGSLITIRITGLKKGTTYYVKCSATGKGGTTTSESTKLITNY